uniref:DEP domain-containing protein n=1 Tax=Taeniopygia guttata TaxID=59729 RepID=H0ZAX6_TAEGU
MESLSSSMKKKATEHHYRAEVMIAGEQLRLRLHDGKLVKDRRFHLRTYPNCFVAKELTDWLIEHKEAPDRETAIRLMQKLMDHYIIHHVCDEHLDYKDAKLLYRFRKDDGTFPLSKDVKVFLRGQSLYEKLVSVQESILKVREENSVKYQRTFLGSEMIDWLIQEGEVENRQEAVELGRALLEHGIIQHVSNRHHFFDSDVLYHFWLNFRRRRRLTELLNENSSRALSESPDSPFCLRKLNPEPGNTSFLSVQPNKEIKVVSAVRRSSITSLSGNSNTYFSTPPTLVFPPVAECNPKSVLKRTVTTEELLSPGAPYVKKTLTGSRSSHILVGGNVLSPSESLMYIHEADRELIRKQLCKEQLISSASHLVHGPFSPAHNRLWGMQWAGGLWFEEEDLATSRQWTQEDLLLLQG